MKVLTSADSKIIAFDDAAGHFAKLRHAGQRIVQCHGTFDLVHPGHIVHFEEARALGDVLVVTLTAEKFVNKGPGRPFFDDTMRTRWLAALACVDYVVIIPFAAAVEAIEAVRPHFYCKGTEYADQSNDVTGNIADDVATVRRCGGEMRYVGSVVHSSTKLLNRHFSPYAPEVQEFCQLVAAECPPAAFRRTVESFAKLKVLVIGDIIFDKYTTVEVQGLTAKDRILSGRYVDESLQAGGALAVLRHLREFTSQVKLIGLTGTESWLNDTLAQYLQPGEDAIVRAKSFTSVVKQRFVESKGEGKGVNKLFSINYLNKEAPAPDVQKALLARITSEIDEADLVIVMDFGHGLMEDKVRELVQRRANFLVVNCQTNSANHGFNVINRRYRRADAFTLDQTEIHLAAGSRNLDYGEALTDLAKTFQSRYAWLTRGATETLGRNCRQELTRCVPFERSPVDTVGAGDAFCAVASLAAVSGVPLPVATFMGQLAGAQAVKVVGNTEPINKGRFLKAGQSMLTV